MHISDERIGGARVTRRFTLGGEAMMAGHIFTGDQVRAIPAANRRALIDSSYLEVWPLAAGAGDAESDSGKPPERHAVHTGGGRYFVFEGRPLNEEPLTREQAEVVAGAVETGVA